MNYYEARKIKDKDGKPTGKWHYTCMNDGQIWPVGYCAQGCTGHDTPEEAAEHCRQYVIDNASYPPDSGAKMPKDVKYRCKVTGCKNWAITWIQTGPPHLQAYYLCGNHDDKKGLSKVVPSFGIMIASW